MTQIDRSIKLVTMAQQQGKQYGFLATLSVIVSIALFSDMVIVHSSAASLFDPLVETGVSEVSPDGKHVGVNVPGIYNLKLDTRGPLKGVRMNQSVLSGFVKVFIDRERAQNGQMRGPIRVSVGGVTMYNNNEPELSSSQR